MNSFSIPAVCENVTERKGHIFKTPPPRRVGHVIKNDMDVSSGEILSSTDYYAFGMQMPGRNFSSPSYRFGFNGMEKDDEVKAIGNSYEYKLRIYDPRLGRFLSVDPNATAFPWVSWYSISENDVIRSIDIDGLEKYIIHQRSFAPWAFFGDLFPGQDPYHGDNRYFSLSDNVTSRINYKATIDLDKQELVGKAQVWADRSNGPSNFYGDPSTDVGNPQESTVIYKTDGKEITLLTGYVHGANPLTSGMPVNPEIEYQVGYRFNKSKIDKGILSVEFELVGKGFPAFETFLEDEKGQRAFVNILSPVSKGEITNLLGRTTELSYYVINFKVDDRGNFIGVESIIDVNGNVVKVNKTLSEWNKLFLEQNPAGDFVPDDETDPDSGSGSRKQ